jgi:hypothetical protein
VARWAPCCAPKRRQVHTAHTARVQIPPMHTTQPTTRRLFELLQCLRRHDAPPESLPPAAPPPSPPPGSAPPTAPPPAGSCARRPSGTAAGPGGPGSRPAAGRRGGGEWRVGPVHVARQGVTSAHQHTTPAFKLMVSLYQPPPPPPTHHTHTHTHSHHTPSIIAVAPTAAPHLQDVPGHLQVLNHVVGGVQEEAEGGGVEGGGGVGLAVHLRKVAGRHGQQAGGWNQGCWVHVGDRHPTQLVLHAQLIAAAVNPRVNRPLHADDRAKPGGGRMASGQAACWRPGGGSVQTAPPAHHPTRAAHLPLPLHAVEQVGAGQQHVVAELVALGLESLCGWKGWGCGGKEALGGPRASTHRQSAHPSDRSHPTPPPHNEFLIAAQASG